MICQKFHPCLVACCTVFAALFFCNTSAALPQVLNHQGRIAVQGVNFDGNGQFKFAFVNSNGTVTYWSNDATSIAGSEPTAAVTLAVVKGLYAVQLGNTTLPNMAAVSPSVLEHADVRLRVWFNDGAKGFQKIVPDQVLAAVPYAIHAREALAADTFGGLLAGDVTGAQGATTIADITVTGKRLTGFTPSAGTLSADDSILSAIGKLDGNRSLAAPLASPTFTGTVSGITASMVGLGNVENTSDAAKPVSTAQRAALDLKAPLASPSFTGTVSGITASMVGLGNVTNTSDADKPVSSAQQNALNLKASLASPTFTGTVGGITASMVGLGNVTNTSDADKPVSSAQQTALNLKANLASPTFSGTVTLPAGSTAAAPLRLATGTNLTAAVFGAVEFDGTNLYLTNNSASPTRKTLAFTDSAIANGAVGSSQLASGLTLGGTTTGTFSGPLTGNATTATSAVSFTGSLAGDVTGTQSATTIAASTVTGKLLTGYVSGAGTISAGDTVLTAINKLNGNDALRAPIASPTFTGTVGGITASMVGLGNVTNTSDADKPVSSAQQTALNLKANLASPTFSGTVTLPAGSTAAAPLRLATGTNLTAAVFGAVEFDGTNLYLTNNSASPTRKTLAFTDSAIANGAVGSSQLASGLTLGGTTTGTFSGPLTGNATTATSAVSFTGSLAGDVTGTQSATTIAASTVTGKLLTGYVSGAGTISAGDTVLTAINKLNGNDALRAPIASPTFTGTVGGITATMVGLGNVTNTSDADKPVSTAQLTALNLKANLASPTFTGTVGGITSTMVGLGNVANTSDADKPVSTAQQTALNLKANLASPSFTGAVSFAAGTTTTAPIRLSSGTNLTTPVAGAVEFDGSQIYLTTSSASRKTLAFADAMDGGIAAERLIAAPVVPVLAWGSRSQGQSTVPNLADVGVVSAGAEHSLALLRNGSVVAWGSNGAGQATVPTAALSGVTKIAAGFAHNLACKTDGTLLAWGVSDSRTTIPAGITTATNVAAGGLHSLALLANGTVRAWGDSTFGQSTVPGTLTSVTAIAAGEHHSLALKSNGEVVGWGSNLADQTTVPAAALSGVTAIAAGWNHSLALKSNGSVIAWGLNNGGQTDVPAAAASGVVQIAAGDTYSLALKTDGTVIAWGFTDAVNPVTVVPTGVTQVAQLAAGGYHALALLSNQVPVRFARLDSAGRLGIGRTPTTNALEVNGNASKNTAGNWLANSDRRIKTEIEPISGALEKLSQVRLVDFRYTAGYLAAYPEIEDRRYPNVIAQEFAEVFPEDVKGSGQLLSDGSEVLQVDTYPLTIYSAAAIQELHRENQLLQKQLSEQEVRLGEQEVRLRKLEALLKNP